MVSLAWIVGIIGILSAVMAAVTAIEVIPTIYEAFTPQFWLSLATVLMLAAIACVLGVRGRTEEY